MTYQSNLDKAVVFSKNLIAQGVDFYSATEQANEEFGASLSDIQKKVSDEAALPAIIHIALDMDGRVLAHFLRIEDCAEFCGRGVKYTHMPYNLNNRDRHPLPLVGSIYRA